MESFNGGLRVDITIYRDEGQRKFIVTVDNGFSTDSITLYDVSISEVGQFVNEIRKDN